MVALGIYSVLCKMIDATHAMHILISPMLMVGIEDPSMPFTEQGLVG